MFDLNTKELVMLSKKLKESPRQFKKAQVDVINKLAYQNKTTMEIAVHRALTVRATGFIKSVIWVESARLSNPVARTGARKKGKFTGWSEQEGAHDKRKHASTTAGRGGNYQRQMTQKARLRPDKLIYNPNTYPARNKSKSKSGRAAQMLAIISRTKDKNPFIMKNHRNLSDGLYMMKGKSLTKLQKFGRIAQPKRKPILEESLRILKSTFDLQRHWAIALNRNGFK